MSGSEAAGSGRVESVGAGRAEAVEALRAMSLPSCASSTSEIASAAARALAGMPAGIPAAVVGATGVGKSQTADELASIVDGEVVSCDSMQVYRGMDVGTAKTPPCERSVPYHCIDIVDPGDPYSAALYQRDAREALGAVASRGRRAVFCGGTGLYLRAALDDMDFPAGEQVGNQVRERYEAVAEREGPERLHAILERRDPASAALVHPHNVRRVVRALEMLEEGRSYAEQSSHMGDFSRGMPALYIGIAMDRQRLYERIDARVDAMMVAGLVEEVEGLVDAGYADAITSMQAIGYKEIVSALRGQCSMGEAVESIKRSTRRYAKRQGTWFRRDPRIHWVELSA